MRSAHHIIYTINGNEITAKRADSTRPITSQENIDRTRLSHYLIGQEVRRQLMLVREDSST